MFPKSIGGACGESSSATAKGGQGFRLHFEQRRCARIVEDWVTTKAPTERAAELNTAGVPSPFEVEYYCLVQEAAALEAVMHRELASVRHTGDREFFRLSLAAAIQAVEQCAPSGVSLGLASR